jgi:hypothetical protein
LQEILYTINYTPAQEKLQPTDEDKSFFFKKRRISTPFRAGKAAAERAGSSSVDFLALLRYT